MTLFAEIILPFALPQGVLTYSSENTDLTVGTRVIVQLRYRFYTGIVFRLLDTPPIFDCKPIADIVDCSPIVTEKHLQVWNWIAQYYLCTIGEVMQAALPSLLKLESETFIKLADNIPVKTEDTQDNEVLQQILHLLSDSKKHKVEDLLAFCKNKKQGYTILHTLIKNEYLEVEGKAKAVKSTKHKDVIPSDFSNKALTLSEVQQQAVDKINLLFQKHDIVLLFAVTASGKTEMYSQIIKEKIAQKKQVLFLVPEIMLTTQLVQRLSLLFGKDVCCYNSKIADGEKRKIYTAVAQKQISIVLGSRSSIFLPFADLGLIIVDEEHDSSYKQQDPSPRYNAKDVSMIIARTFGAKVLLGSATPSLESMYMAKAGKYGMVEVAEKFHNTQLPKVMTVDMKKEKKSRSFISFSSLLTAKITEKLSAKEQVILFINRRGYAPLVQCQHCFTIQKCKYCNVSLTYHKIDNQNQLVCHYCNHTVAMEKGCQVCAQHQLLPTGTGTEKIEEELSRQFPLARVERFDLDATRSRKRMENLLSDTKAGKIDILVGTQMVVKGIDFHNITLVGVISADMMLSFPDFRSSERAYQQLVQVSGRAGRGEKAGEVVLQTFSPKHAIIRQAVYQEYQTMYEEQILQRQEFGYPPFVRLIVITLQHHNEVKLRASALQFKSTILQHNLPVVILGPQSPYINKIKNLYLQHFMLKLDRNNPYSQEIKRSIGRLCDSLKQQTSGLRISIDVDPLQ